MSKDMIGSIARAIVGVPLHLQGVLLDIINRLSGGDGDDWHARLKESLQSGSLTGDPAEGTLFKTIKTGAVAAVQGGMIKDCFANAKRYFSHPQDFIAILPDPQPATSGCRFSVCEFICQTEFAKIMEMAGILLGKSDRRSLSKLLIAGGCMWTLPEIELIIERSEAGEDVGLSGKGRANVFPVLSADGDVFIVKV